MNERRYLSGACWAGNCDDCTDRVCEHDCGHETNPANYVAADPEHGNACAMHLHQEAS